MCQCDGYKSLKAAVVRDKGRSKKEIRERFIWAIARAKHYAHHQNRPIEEVLNEWESKRKQWWFGYYDDSQQPRLNKSDLVVRMSPKNYYKKGHFYKNDPIGRKKGNLAVIMRSQQQNAKRKGKKARWPMEQKKRQARRKSVS